MTIYKKTGAHAALLLAALLLGGPALAGQAYAVKDNVQTYGKWQLDKTNGMVRIQTHGTRVQGHQFGLILTPEHCNEPIGWIAWSSSKSRPDAFRQVRDAKLVFTVNGKDFPAVVPLSSVMPITANLTALALTNYEFSDRFLSLVQHAKTIKLRVVGPPALLQLLDVTEDTFSARGFSKARRYANAMCAFAGKRK